VPVLLDGVYVSASKLENAEFRSSLVGFLRALREGWQEVRVAPSLSLEAVRSVVKDFNKELELKSLESILTLIPPARAVRFVAAGKPQPGGWRVRENADLNDYTPQNLWTRRIWNQLRREDGDPGVFAFATKYYVDHISHLWLFKLDGLFRGVHLCIVGVLWRRLRRYDLWQNRAGFFVVGDRRRDQGPDRRVRNRIPFYYVRITATHSESSVSCFCLRCWCGAIPMPMKAGHQKRKKVFRWIFLPGRSRCDLCDRGRHASGSGCRCSPHSLVPWASSLRDIVINQEPHTFRV
jgi:hypothetical protein